MWNLYIQNSANLVTVRIGELSGTFLLHNVAGHWPSPYKSQLAHTRHKVETMLSERVLITV